MNRNIKYSIIIPHKNTPDLLWRCLNSIPQRPDIQVIVVDDNSDVNVVDFENFPGSSISNVEVIFTKKGGGAGYARNVGLSKAVGKWLMFSDADDYYSNNAFTILDQELEDNLDVLYFNISDGSNNGMHKENRAFYFNRLYKQYEQDLNDIPIRFGCWVPWNKVILRDYVECNNFRFDEIPVGNDAMFNLRVSKSVHHYKIIQDKLYCLADMPNSITFKPISFDRILNYLYINAKIDNFLIENGYTSLCINLLGIRTIIRYAKRFGLKNACIYLYRLHSYIGIFRAIYINIKINRK